MQFKSTFDLIDHILVQKDFQEFRISPTTYGSEITCHPELEFTDHEFLEIRILEIDSIFTDNLELGTHRIYKFEKFNGEVLGEVYCRMEYSAHFNSEDSSLQNELKKKVLKLLSCNFECSENDFLDRYYFQLYHNTLDDAFGLTITECENEIVKYINEIKLEEIKSCLKKFMEQKSTNTREFDCHYEFSITDVDAVIFEFWETDFDVNQLLDNRQYTFS